MLRIFIGLTLVLTLHSYNLYAVDNLWKFPVDTPVSSTMDTTAIVALVSEANSSISKNTQEAVSKSQSAFEASKAIGWDKGMAISSRTLGYALDRMGKYQESHVAHMQAYEYYKRTGNWGEMAGSWINSATPLRKAGDYDKALEVLTEGAILAKRAGKYEYEATAYGNMGNVYDNRGNHQKAIEFQLKSIELNKQIGDKKGVAVGSLNISTTYKNLGDHGKAIELLFQALGYFEKIGDDYGLGICHENLGLIYSDMDEDGLAEKHYLESIRIRESSSDKRGLASAYNNLGTMYYGQGNYDRSEQYHKKALEIRELIGERSGVAYSANNLGSIYIIRSEREKAIAYKKRSYEIRRQIGAINGAAKAMTGMVYAYLKFDEMDSVKYWAAHLEHVLDSIDELTTKQDIHKALYHVYEKTGESSLALAAYKNFIELRDSSEREANVKAVLRQQYQYDYEKKELAIQKEMELSALKFEFEQKQAAARTEKEKQQLRYEEELKRNQIEADYAQRQAVMEAEQKQKDVLAKAEQDKKDAIAIEQLRRKNQQRNAFIGGFALTLGLAGVSYRSYRRKKRDNTVITAQKVEVEKQKDAIVASITYAKKLQEAVLPPPKVVKEFFADSFLLYLPRDIVSGDFYWMESANGINYFAVGDCTGHGVPGAMLSVMGLNGLNRALNELNIIQPADFLTQLTKDLHDAFLRSDTMVRDGMDMSICALDITNRKLTFAGANNPLWIARNGEIIVHRPNRRSVGHHDNANEGFSQITIDLEVGDTIYLMTDGYADQLGGPSGKKMYTKVFRERLAQLSTMPLPKQREQLIADLNAWKGNSGHQTDDVCVMGVKV